MHKFQVSEVYKAGLAHWFLPTQPLTQLCLWKQNHRTKEFYFPENCVFWGDLFFLLERSPGLVLNLELPIHLLYNLQSEDKLFMKMSPAKALLTNQSQYIYKISFTILLVRCFTGLAASSSNHKYFTKISFKPGTVS